MTEISKSQSPVYYADETDLREIIRVLWAGKWIIGAVTFASALIAIAASLMMPNIYQSEALLAPNDREISGGLSAVASQYSGIATLAGFNLASGSSNKAQLGLKVLESRRFISDFIERRQLLVPLLATKEWNSETNELQIDPDVHDIGSGEWVGYTKMSRKSGPSRQEAYEAFSKLLSVSQDKQEGFIKVAISHYSPFVAKQWVDWLIEDLNATILHQDVTEARQAIKYLNEQIENTSVANLQSVFFRLIEEQTKTIMLAEVADEYLFKTIDPAVVPESHSRPKRVLVVILAVAIGFALGVVFVAASRSLRGPKNA